MPFVKRKELVRLRAESKELSDARGLMSRIIEDYDVTLAENRRLAVSLERMTEERDRWKDIVRNRMRNFKPVTAEEISDTNINEKENS